MKGPRPFSQDDSIFGALDDEPSDTKKDDDKKDTESDESEDQEAVESEPSSEGDKQDTSDEFDEETVNQIATMTHIGNQELKSPRSLGTATPNTFGKSGGIEWEKITVKAAVNNTTFEIYAS